MLALLPVLALASVGPPATPPPPVSDSYFGTTVVDPYRWLEDAADPAVRAWSDAQNARTRAYLDELLQRAPIKEELTKLIYATSPSYAGLKRGGPLVFGFYTQPPKQQPMLAVLDASGDPDRARVLVDPNLLSAKGKLAIDWFVPSPDGSLVAVSLSEGGSEDGTLHLFEVASGRDRGENIPGVQYPTAGGSLAWRGDAKGFWYTRYPGPECPETDRHFYQRVFWHALGTDPAKDPEVFGRELPDPKVAEILLTNQFDPERLVAMVQKGDGGEYLLYAMTPDGQWHQVAGYADRIIAAAFGPDHALYLVSRKGAPRSRILRLAPGDLDLSHAVALVEQSDGTIEGIREQGALPFSLTPDRLFVKEIVGGPSRVDVFDLSGKHLGAVPLPPVSASDEVLPLADGTVLCSVATYLEPRYYLRYDPSSGRSEKTKLAQQSPVSFADSEVVREFATSKDGTRVPINLIRRKGTKSNGKNPVLLYGYGGYGISLIPSFLGAERRVWLDGGGIYAIANLRGGGEYGEDWHRQGALTHKQNVFDDFFAAAQFLVTTRVTSKKHLAIMGGSNGGLLMGAELTQHPAAFQAVVANVGIYDMLRVELDPNGAFNTTEFGTVKDRDQFEALYRYSPYHNVKNGVAYPTTLFMTGANDGRVNPLQSRKMVARLQAAGASKVRLRTSADSGHGHGSALSVRIDQSTDYLSFLFAQLGMRLKSGSP